MNITKFSQEYHERMFPDYVSKFRETDPEFIERFDNFAFDEVVNQDDLDGRTRFMAILATLLGCQGVDEFRAMLPAALNFGVTPVEIKEITYQAVAYLGIGRVFPFLKAVNDVLTECGVKLPLPPQATTTTENRREAGTQAQVDIFGEGMRDFWQSGPEETRHINKWLADNCFGDYYTRKGLDYKEREMITFCFLAAQGGCEPQLTAHATGNMKVGNDKAFLIKIVSQCLPYIGYPRSLNAIRCINEAAQTMTKKIMVEKQLGNIFCKLGVNLMNKQWMKKSFSFFAVVLLVSMAMTAMAKTPDETSAISRELAELGGAVQPIGSPNDAYAKYFTGQSYLSNLSTDKNLPVYNVTFAHGAHTFWHIHHGTCQILVAQSGQGYYQIWGEEPQKLLLGMTATIPAGVKHWHGAAPGVSFQHIALMEMHEGISTEWLEPVKDADYRKLK